MILNSFRWELWNPSHGERPNIVYTSQRLRLNAPLVNVFPHCDPRYWDGAPDGNLSSLQVSLARCPYVGRHTGWVYEVGDHVDRCAMEERRRAAFVTLCLSFTVFPGDKFATVL